MLVEAAMQAGQLRAGDPEEAARLLWAGLHGNVSLAVSFRGQFSGFEPDAVLSRARALTDSLLASLS
jgi:hypothetical protein